MSDEKEDLEREAFEAWYASTYLPTTVRGRTFRKYSTGVYCLQHAQDAWQAWGAAKSHAEQSKWISVEDRMPESRNNLEQFLIVSKWDSGLEKHFYRVSNVLNISKHVYFGDVPCDASVTHWQTLPEPPEQGETK